MAVVNKSIREKSAARMIAVQLIYSRHSQGKACNTEAMLVDAAAFRDQGDGADFGAIFKDKPHAPKTRRQEWP